MCLAVVAAHRLKSFKNKPPPVHAWDYRRYVLASMPVKRPELDELAYTTRKIEANFSNFSAWHQRSKVYASLWEQGVSDEARDKISGSLILNAFVFLSLTTSLYRIFPGQAGLIRRSLRSKRVDISQMAYRNRYGRDRVASFTFV